LGSSPSFGVLQAGAAAGRIEAQDLSFSAYWLLLANAMHDMKHIFCIYNPRFNHHHLFTQHIL
jgi:hypothetical protein